MKLAQTPPKSRKALVVTAAFVAACVPILVFSLAIAGRVLAQGDPASPSAPPPAVSGAGPESQWVNVVAVVPGTGELLGDEIVFFFSEDMVIPTGPDGEREAPFGITPPLEGSLRTWPRVFRFRVAQGSMQAHQIYAVELNPGLRSVSGKVVNPAQRSYRFPNFTFEPERVWTIEESPDRSILGLLFALPVDLDALEAHLTVRTHTGESVPFELERAAADTMFRLALAGSTDWPVTITVAAGLRDRAGEFALIDDRAFVYPTKKTFDVDYLAWGAQNGNVQEIVIGFSQAVRPDDLRRHLRVTNNVAGTAMPYDVATAEPMKVHRLRVTLEDPSAADLTLRISRQLPGAERTVLAVDYSGTLRKVPPPLRVERVYWGDFAAREQQVRLGFSRA
ncbi:MAG TPA: hypothetical protein HPP77_10250, partial [Candidatus Hydrogenedentes bacterium]|nr:hypothetical protein [Candidatus Hydrogenedentota bacterium]